MKWHRNCCLFMLRFDNINKEVCGKSREKHTPRLSSPVHVFCSPLPLSLPFRLQVVTYRIWIRSLAAFSSTFLCLDVLDAPVVFRGRLLSRGHSTGLSTNFTFIYLPTSDRSDAFIPASVRTIIIIINSVQTDGQNGSVSDT